MSPTIRNIDKLVSFSKAVWGNPQAITEHDDVAGVDYIDLTDHIATSNLLLGKPIEKILIRQEYLTALDALESNELYGKAAYVTGQPGIGKTLFLAYILVMRLGQKRPVAWHLTSDTSPPYILFRDTASVHPLDDSDALSQYDSLWGLSDSNNKVEEPPYAFYAALPPVRTIQATSPRERRWMGWSKYADANCYVMDIWSQDEIVALAKLLRLDVKRMDSLAKEWGGVPRTLLRYLRLPNDEIKDYYRFKALTAAKKGKEALASVESGFPDDAPSLFYFYRPQLSPERTIKRMLSRAVVPTATLRTFLGEALQQCNTQVRLDFLGALSQYDETRQAAGYIYENWFHSYFCAGQSIECHWLRDPGNTRVRRSNRLSANASPNTPATTSAEAPSEPSGVSSLTGQKVLLPATQIALMGARPPYYWVAPKTFAGIDSVLVLDEGIYAFQITISSKHGEPTKGLHLVADSLPSNVNGLPWKVVVVGDTDSAKKVAMSWKRRVKFSQNNQQIIIGWSVVDPMSEGVTYQALFDEESKDTDSAHWTTFDNVDVEMTDA